MMSTTSGQNRPTMLGVLLILIGAVFLADKMDWFDFSWPVILIIVGIGFLSDVLANRRSGMIFVGSLLVFLGLAFLASDLHWIPRYYDTWPLVLIAVGLAFLVSFIARPDNSGSLIPAGILIGVGALFMLAEMDIIRWHRVWDILRYWPAILILAGLVLLVRGRK